MELTVKYDGGRIETHSVDDVLAWREWSQRDADKIASVALGDLRRFCTDHDGVPCDIEGGAL